MDAAENNIGIFPRFGGLAGKLKGIPGQIGKLKDILMLVMMAEDKHLACQLFFPGGYFFKEIFLLSGHLDAHIKGNKKGAYLAISPDISGYQVESQQVFKRLTD